MVVVVLELNKERKIMSVINQINVGEMSEKNVGEKLTDRQKKILKYIEQNNVISAKEISVLLQITDRTVERDIQKLKEMGILERIGSGWMVEHSTCMSVL